CRWLLDGLGEDFGRHAADATEANGLRGSRREVEHPAAHERAAIIDRDDDATVAVRDADAGAKWQRPMRGGHGAGVHALAGGGAVAGLIAVVRRDAGERPARAGAAAISGRLG